MENQFKRKYGSTALVTGASSGIGREVAYQLAEQGFDLLITARSGIILAEIAEEIMDQYDVDVRTFTSDLSIDENVTDLVNLCEEHEIGLAVLNAGFGTSGELVDSDLKTELNLVNLNCLAVLHLTHYFSRRFSNEGNGGIVLLSSVVGFQGAPNAANYAASKAYVQSLGEGIALELKPKGVDVLCVAPGPVETGFARRAKMNMGSTMNPKVVASAIINSLGKTNTVYPGGLSKLLNYSLRTAPRWARVQIMNKIMGGMASGNA